MNNPSYTQKNPFYATLIEKRSLNPVRGEKETMHFVLDIQGSGIEYETGDILGIMPTNDPQEVESLLQALEFKGSEKVLWGRSREAFSIEEILTKKCCLRFVPKQLLLILMERLTCQNERKELKILFDPACSESLQTFQNNHSLLDVAEAFSSAKFEPQEYVDTLTRLHARLYSIASSPKKDPNKIELVVSIVRYHLNDRIYGGVTSTFLADRVSLNQPNIPVFLAKSSFRLPEDNNADVIMVGPGSGIAPFRAFLQERDAIGAKGRNWLFFGDQHRESDFLYEEELKNYQRSGLLTQLDLAFSRDQEYKIYVQHRMKENAKELWEWIDNGAYFYVCGDATRMARDVEDMLLHAIQKHGHMTTEDASTFLKEMRRTKRYQKDVY